MDLNQIETALSSEDPQARLRGLTALRAYDAAIAAPLLLQCIHDPETIVRSFVALGLGYKQSDAGFTALVQVMQEDADPNVRSEAAAALSKYGAIALPYLTEQFQHDQHWLMRMSILLAIAETAPPATFLALCRLTLTESEPAVQTTALEQLPTLIGSTEETAALDLILSKRDAPTWMVRRQVALSLQAFTDQPRARQALLQLRQDGDYRVIAASLESLVVR